jgi:hypothetical protein
VRPAVMPPSGPLPLPAPPSGPVQNPAAQQRQPGFPNLSNLPTMIADLESETDSGQAKTSLGGETVDPDHGATTPDRRSPLPPQHGGPPAQGAMAGYPVMSAEMSEQIARGADIFPSRPPNAPPQAAPVLPPPQLPQAPPMQHGMHDSGQQAAHLMSPVGQHYPQQVNWAEAAAMPARAIPPWLLGLLFVGAIGLALVITIVIAKIAR